MKKFYITPEAEIERFELAVNIIATSTIEGGNNEYDWDSYGDGVEF